ncbi:MAG TPA: SDR family NAD(P)-dependent oxidoreductase, partial [Acidimicrobiales bacterium]|nr:SDR family NAD(P)-dependent oxidoreductase [Acidimicrobiales bacterium]
MGGAVEGKRIVVTGASRGLGRAFAVALAAEGAKIVVNGTNAALLDEVAAGIVADGGEALAVVGSVANDDLAEKLVTTCVGSFGGIDAVVNNAGIVRDRTLVNMTPDEFDDVVAVNLRGTWSVSRHAARAMKESGGLLLQVVSNAAFVGSVGQTNYAASKAGVMGMLYSWDVELRRFGIRVNALWPIAQTDMTQIVFDNATKRATEAGQPPPTPKQLGFGTPESVAPIVVHMCSDRAAHVRSQLVTFNGSKLALWSHPHETVLARRDVWTLDDLATT